jgi:hypothetical protein
MTGVFALPIASPLGFPSGGQIPHPAALVRVPNKMVGEGHSPSMQMRQTFSFVWTILGQVKSWIGGWLAAVVRCCGQRGM